MLTTMEHVVYKPFSSSSCPCRGVQPDEIERLGLATPPKTAVSCAMRFFLPLADLVRVYLELRASLGIGFVFVQIFGTTSE